MPWIAIAVYLTAPGGAAHAPGFVYGIYVSLLAFFFIFAGNQWLQYAALGRWATYMYGERVYILLSIVAKSALAWQVYGSTLAAE